MNKVLEWFVKIWMALCAVFILFSIATLWWFEGWPKVQEIFSPFNFINCISLIVLLSPALLASWWLEKNRAKENSK